MALSKSVENENGSFSNYWRITGVTLNKNEKTAMIKISGFLNSSKIANTSAKEFMVYGNDFDTYFPSDATVNFYAQAYVYLKTQDFFSGSEDV
jgi:hypothetical protein